MKVKKIPLRQCIGCMEGKPKKELIRIVKNKEGEIKIDFTSKAAGRGAYICNNVECLAKAQKKKALNRAFEQEIDQSIYQQLQEELEKHVK
ncbi:RNase P modulator RnpM [Geosporobacter ferrireducens]|uniref:Nucleic acid-binding protein n=1 Tax=Geosporobacter ferrireducens TaxID=1424294 RepID=A0A1D8GBE8_9FIRM|nr:YlxR family protein [Geosporobacter ferrireducens]AOT68237.1 nucleic acid-binding protein [Geosporobacter ferrireducens]MTI57344.1 YlxR family protein [Geosporobacter ferrireducens]